MLKAPSLLLSLVALLGVVRGARAEDLDTAKLDQARSVIAEAAMLERAASERKVTHAYAEGLRQSLKDDLEDLAKDPAFAPFAREALAALARHDAVPLAGLRDRLVQLERSHGRAG